MLKLRRILAVLVISTALTCDIAAADANPIQTLLTRLRAVDAAECDTSTEAYLTNYPYARLQLRKAALQGEIDRRYSSASPASADTFAQEGLAALDRLDAQQPMRAVPGKLTEAAYITRNDKTAQPLHIYLPPAYDPSTPTPLIVFLHGWVPETNILDPWLPPQAICDLAGKYGCMLVVPYARRNTDFQGVGEVDVFRAIEEVQRLYSVDDDRVYLCGVSMGGMGAWTIGLRHPGVFAAVAPITGQTEMYRWWGWNRDAMAPWKQWMVEWDNPYHLADSLRNANIFVQHGELDSLISIEQSRLMVKAAEERQYFGAVELFEHPGASHYIYFENETFDRAFEWLAKHTLDRKPEIVTHKTYSLEYGRAFWASIDAFQKWGEPGRFSIYATPDIQKNSLSHIDLTTTNVARLSIDIPSSPLARLDRYRVLINDTEHRWIAPEGDKLIIDIAPPPASVIGAPADAAPATFPPQKRAGLCGPCEEVFDTDFVVVAGTAGKPSDDRRLVQNAMRFAIEWDAFADGFPRVMRDTDVTAADIASSNLVLFGRPQTNLITSRIASRLPIRIGNRHYMVGDREFQGEDLGLAMCYPNPLNPEKYVLIFDGAYWGDEMSVNHKFDMLPDFIIFSSEAYEEEGPTNLAHCAGFFDMNWQLSDALTYTWKGNE